MQYPDLYKNFCETGEADEVEDDVNPEITKTVLKHVLAVDKKPLKFILVKGNDNHDPRTVEVFHTNMWEIGVHFLRNGSTLGGNLAQVDYALQSSNISLSVQGRTCTIDNIPSHSHEGIVYIARKGNDHKSLILCAEQKSVP